MKLDTAIAIAQRTLVEGRDRGFAPLTVAVLDTGGHLVVLLRADGTSLLRPQIATGKAYGALGMGFGSRELSARAAKMPAFFNALIAMSDGRMVPVPGGVLVYAADGALLGAVGASGDTSDNDETCIVAAVVAAGLRAETG